MLSLLLYVYLWSCHCQRLQALSRFAVSLLPCLHEPLLMKPITIWAPSKQQNVAHKGSTCPAAQPVGLGKMIAVSM